ncbi:preprotein translocase subunit SecA [Amygdalobacter nucleatus]|uniref:Protein translocase subunit SecA n=1 Tax=Amygdalobacter nucleatus TaxID=3029274 RepID=A0A133YFQ0_9FIRM|nr:preprotein translocase subunit SecA [Amygdalobacter nucleatus]KXB42014.1 preprotein translocase, SecA subunit [Amygdalobacter nucleatus]MDF0485671.1 preprotein translocase subunit SecA [Amygdalobacter nucleatus]WEG36479.1 preprotein translocase subunit SecA [Amygdalobacter nucleatus]
MGIIDKIFGTHSEREIKRLMPLVEKIESLEPEYSKLSEAELKAKTPEFKQRLQAGESLDDILPEAFATCREAAWRVLGMKHYRVQLIGGIVLHQGRIAEMKTGEGKTLVATLPVYLNALSGEGVHVVTVNDYLAQRDSEWMGKVYRYLGLTVGLIVHDKDSYERKEAYASDITYGTNNEFGFDYLRDNMVVYKERCVQRALNFAIVDEVDSILIDEARTPLIISGQGDDATDMYQRADQLVRGMKALHLTETDEKVEQDEYAEDADYVVDEKAKTAVLTRRGVKKTEKFFGITNLADEANYDVQHYVSNALKAHGTMLRDQQYIVQDDEIVIVDDFTGRLMYGRRYSDGLHQAIEAKEGVEVKKESKTLATITFQNFFRMYNKLSGMTGTATTEEQEFRDIYNLDVVTIPTNKPLQRIDEHDAVFKTINGKLNAIVEEVKAAQAKGQPVLVGTVNVDSSERISDLFKRNGISHNVLNAKQHAREAEIIAQAGRIGQVTIATNMAGRGTDILLGGNAEYLALQELRKQGFDEELIVQANAYNETDDPAILDIRERFKNLYDDFKKITSNEHDQVVKVGGLYIIGTERHESRRIDNQLRGRAGRQGDPGKSKFYLSLEDDLLRLFGGAWIKNLFDKLNVDENMEIQAKYLNRNIANAQKAVEGQNYAIRRRVFEYDNVMNKQREIIYDLRRKVLDGEDLKPIFTKLISNTAKDIVATYANGIEDFSNLDYLSLANKISYVFGGLDCVNRLLEIASLLRNREASDDEICLTLANGEKFYPARLSEEQLVDEIVTEAMQRYADREAALPAPELMREAERVILLRVIDDHWMEHIDAMDDMRNSIGMRGYGQHDPVVEYTKEGYAMFEAMNDLIRENAVRLLMLAQITAEKPMERRENKQELSEAKEEGNTAYQAAESEQNSAGEVGERESKAEDNETRMPVKRDKRKIGRNENCWCGSNKKYKDCHLMEDRKND